MRTTTRTPEQIKSDVAKALKSIDSNNLRIEQLGLQVEILFSLFSELSGIDRSANAEIDKIIELKVGMVQTAINHAQLSRTRFDKELQDRTEQATKTVYRRLMKDFAQYLPM